LIALQKRGTTTSPGANAGGNANDGNADESGSQKEIKLHTALVGHCPIAEICAAVADGVRTIGVSERPVGSPNFLEEIRTHYFQENGVAIPSGTKIVIDDTFFELF
jgi:hypothetical protein